MKRFLFVSDFLDWFTFKFQNPYKVDPQGVCPVQAEGLLPNKKFYYFRARGAAWALEIAETEEDFHHGSLICRIKEDYGTKFEAGWMSRREAIKFATKAINQYFDGICVVE